MDYIRQGSLLPQSVEPPGRLSFALPVTAVNQFIVYPSQTEWGLSRDPPSMFMRSVAGCDRLPVILSFFTQCPRNLQKKWRGLEGNYWDGADTSSLSRVTIGKRHKSDISPPGPTTADSLHHSDVSGDAKNWTTPTPKADSRRCQSLRIIRNTGLCSEAHDSFIVISVRDNYCLFYLGIKQYRIWGPVNGGLSCLRIVEMRSGQSLCCYMQNTSYWHSII